MARPNEPKTETVRIDLPLPSAGKSADQNMKETVRIQLPVREPQVTPPSFSPQLTASVMPAPDSPSLGPKKETIRVPVANPISSAGQMKSTQSAVAIPSVGSQNSLIANGRREKNRMLLWWMLLGVSAVILIIQIWTYLS